MEIKTLEGIPFSSIITAFHKAFSDYPVNFSFTEESFGKKLFSENIKLEASPAAFVDGEIVGFILHGLDEVDGVKRVFNGGTGVVPEQRGKRIVQHLYEYIFPILKEKGYSHHQLEVLGTNTKAAKSYEKVGFSKAKSISSFKGTISDYKAEGITLKKVKTIDWDVAKTFFDIEPTWQNSTETVLRMKDMLEIIAAYRDDNFVGFVAFDPVGGRIKQFGVKKDERKKGIGKTLLSYVNNAVGEVSFTNYDQSDTDSVTFFKALGLNEYFESYEMRMIF